MTTTLLGALLLAVSLVSVLIYMSALGQFLVSKKRPGLIRTGLSRLAAALLYVGVGLATLQAHEVGPRIGLAIYSVVQIMWWINSIADVRLARKLGGNGVDDSASEPLGVSEPTPNYATPLPDVVVSAEIDLLSTKQGNLKRRIDTFEETENRREANNRWWHAAQVFTGVVAVLALIFALAIYSRADQANTQAQENKLVIQKLKETQARIDAQQVRQDLTIREFCGLYDSFLGFYNPKSKLTFPEGPDAYDEAFRRLVVSAEHLQCGLKPPRELR